MSYSSSHRRSTGSLDSPDRRRLAGCAREERQVARARPRGTPRRRDLEVGDAADLGVHLGAAHLLLGDVLPGRRLHQVATAERHRRRALDHRDEVGERGDVRRARRAVAEHRRDLRHDARQRHLLAEQVRRRRRTSNPVEAWIRAPAESSSHTIGMRWRSDELRADAAVLCSSTCAHRAGHHGEVVGAHRDPAAVDLADAGDAAVGREVALVGQRGIHRVGELSELDERAGVEQQVDALPDGPSCPSSAGARRASGPPIPVARSRRAARSSTSGFQSWRLG